MKTKPLLHTILFSSMLAVSFTAAAAQAASASGSGNASISASANGSIIGSADAGANASGPAEQLATRYAELFGSTEAAAELVQQLHVDSDTGAIMRYAEIDNALALTSAMLDSGAATNVDAALATVMRVRADGTTWNAVAQKLGYKLGTVVSAAHRTGAAGVSAVGAAGLRGSASGRAGGMSAPTLPQVPQLPSLPRIGL